MLDTSNNMQLNTHKTYTIYDMLDTSNIY